MRLRIVVRGMSGCLSVRKRNDARDSVAGEIRLEGKFTVQGPHNLVPYGSYRHPQTKRSVLAFERNRETSTLNVSSWENSQTLSSMDRVTFRAISWLTDFRYPTSCPFTPLKLLLRKVQ